MKISGITQEKHRKFVKGNKSQRTGERRGRREYTPTMIPQCHAGRLRAGDQHADF
jgi:hypothetical protein